MHLKFPTVALPNVLSGLALRLVSAGIWGVLALWAGYRLIWLIAPAPLYLPSWQFPDPQADAQRVAQRHWFGESRPPPAPSLRVLGVFAPQYPSSADGFAVVEEGGQMRSMHQGQANAGGWVLERVNADGITLRRGERLQVYPLATGTDGVSPSTDADEEPPYAPGDD